MKQITEEMIENLIDAFEADENLYFDVQDAIIKEHVAFAALLSDDELRVLTEEEFDLLWFLAVVIFQLASGVSEEDVKISPKLVEDIDERNWDEWNNSKRTSYKDKLDDIFDGYAQEDLLSFVEDSLISDEDMEVSSTGRELIFITCKTMIDSLDSAIK